MGLAWSHIYSRLLYNTHIWSNFSGKARDMISNKYNKVWRKIAGLPRFDAKSRSDFDIRCILNVPSVDCVVRKRRLKYLYRLARANVPVLNIILQFKSHEGEVLPSVQLVVNDMRILKVFVSPKLDSMPDPMLDPNAWWHIMSNFQHEWKQLVDSYHVIADDMHAPAQTNVSLVSPLSYICNVCSASFANNKSLLQHCRIKHKAISLPARCLEDTSTCPICETIFQNRLAVVTHLSELRIRSKVRGTCCGLEYARSNPTALPTHVAETLNARDRGRRKAALAKGYSHEIIRLPAKRKHKKCSAAIPTKVLRQLAASGGVKRRLFQKTMPAIAGLRFKPRSYIDVDKSGKPAKRINVKSRPIVINVSTMVESIKRRRLWVKTTPCHHLDALYR